jgi:arylsulfatase
MDRHAVPRRVPSFGFRRVAGLATAALLLVGVGCPGAAEPGRDAPAEMDRPDLLLITVDTLRWDHLGCYGYPKGTSPSIDALARDSVVFDRAYVPIPKTTPSIASLMTGLYPQSHKNLELRRRLPDVHDTLAERLLDAGYRTAGIVGQYNLHRTMGLNQGFETYSDEFPTLAPSKSQGGKFDAFSEKRADTLVDEAVAWLAEPRSDPSFLWVHFMDPHAAYDPPPPHDETFAGENYEERDLPVERIHLQAYEPPKTSLAYYLQRYDGEIRYLDDQIGRLLDALRESGRYDSTMIVFTTDHGEFIGDPDGSGVPYFSHGTTLSEGEIRAPLLWKLPVDWEGRAAPRREPGVVETVDVMPTLVELLQLQSIDADGRSLEAALLDEGELADAAAYTYSYEANTLSLQSGEWKLVYYPGHSLAMFFMREIDIDEVTDDGKTVLYRLPSLETVDEPEITRRFRKALFDRLERVFERSAAGFPLNDSIDDPDTIRRLESLGYL